VGEPSGGLRFPLEAGAEAAVGGVLGAEHLDGDVAAEQQIVPEEDHRHPAMPDLAVDPVAAVDGGLLLDHGRRRPSGVDCRSGSEQRQTGSP
jgi:hypothetical protein